MCPDVAVFKRIHLWEGKSASIKSCKSSNALPDKCGQKPWVLVVLWGRVNVVTAWTFLEHIFSAVDCPGQNSRKPGPGWCRRFIGERRNWLFSLSHTTVPGCWMLYISPGSAKSKQVILQLPTVTPMFIWLWPSMQFKWTMKRSSESTHPCWSSMPTVNGCDVTTLTQTQTSEQEYTDLIRCLQRSYLVGRLTLEHSCKLCLLF